MSNITAQEATRIAKEYFQSVIGNYGIQTTIEEVERNEKNNWVVTLSYRNSNDIFTSPDSREYKIFEIQPSTGDVLSMKIKKNFD